MRTIWHSLAWKEWHEHRWKLAALTAILCGVSHIALLATAAERHDEFIAFMMLAYIILPLAVFLGAHDAADERGRGTQTFLQSLPAPLWQVAVWKLAFGIATCIVPIAIALVGLAAMIYSLPRAGADLVGELERGRDAFPMLIRSEHLLLDWFVSVGIYSSMAGASVYLWTAACGVGRKDEVRAGVWGLLAIVAWWSVVALTISGIEREGPLVVALLAISPAGAVMALVIAMEGRIGFEVSVPIVITIAAAVHAALAAWFIIRFGRTAEHDRFSRRTVRGDWRAARWIGLPRRNPFTAILWKQFRESTPIVLAGLAAILCFFVANLITNAGYYAEYQSQIPELLTQLTTVFGFLIALVVGIGVFDRDLGPKVNQFWRSRPIHPDLWFWTKYATGLGVLLVAVYLPLLVGSIWSSVPVNPNHPDVSMMLCLQVAVYSAAMAMICLIRQPVYAAILGVGVLLIGVSLVMYFFGQQALQIEGVVFATELVTAVLATLLAWLTVRYDWGSKG